MVAELFIYDLLFKNYLLFKDSSLLDLEDRKTAEKGKTGGGSAGGWRGSWQLKRLGCTWKSECTLTKDYLNR